MIFHDATLLICLCPELYDFLEINFQAHQRMRATRDSLPDRSVSFHSFFVELSIIHLHFLSFNITRLHTSWILLHSTREVFCISKLYISPSMTTHQTPAAMASYPESRVLIVMTGGTICMRSSPEGLVPATGFLEQAMAPRPSFNDGTKPGECWSFF